MFQKCVISISPDKTNPLRQAVKEVFFKIIDDRALDLLCRKISQSSGDIRVVFDIMKSAFGKLEQTVNGLETIEEIKQKCVISMSGIIEVFDSKKGLKVKDTLKSLPRQDIIVLDSICNLFDLTGEEKVLAIDQVFHQV